jgi:alkylation response protein AidB-like acyl-CoA dehydrogenase
LSPDSGQTLTRTAVKTLGLRRDIFEAEHIDFRSSVRDFLAKEAVPHQAEWEQHGTFSRDFWRKAAAHGFVGFEAPEANGGLGLGDYRFNAILTEEACYAGILSDSFMLQNDVIAPYLIDLTTDEQRDRWLTPFTCGELLCAIGMTEPGAGSDVRAIQTRAHREGDVYVVNGSKTFITSGIEADLVVTAVKTATENGRASISLLGIERGMEGFQRGRKLQKVGRHSIDTAELFFNDVRVPVENLIGEVGRGFEHLTRNLARERLAVAVGAVAAAEHALAITLEYVKDRSAFGRTIGSFQVNKHELARLRTELAGVRRYVDDCITAEIRNELSAAEAAGVKALSTELQWEIVDRCVQLHGGYGYMEEYEIARHWRDARVQRIFGGTTEIMWEIVGRSLGL